MNKKKRGPVVAGLVLLGLVFLWGCGSSGGGSPEGGGPPVAVTGVVLGITGSPNIALDENPPTRQLAWQVVPANAANQQVTFTSDDDDEDVVTVGTDGLVTAVGVGTATITVHADNGNFTATVSVKVVEDTEPLMGISIYEGAALTLTGPESKTLTAVLTPSDATEAYEWSTDDGNTVAVTQGGIITAKQAGSATITVAKTDDPTNVNATIAITVAEPKRGIKITGFPSSLDGKKFSLGLYEEDPRTLELEDLSELENYITAGAEGTIASGTIDVVVLKNGPADWMGTGNYWIGIMVGDDPGNGDIERVYLAQEVGFSFAVAKQELTLNNFDDETSNFFGEGATGKSIRITGISGISGNFVLYILSTTNPQKDSDVVAGTQGTITDTDTSVTARLYTSEGYGSFTNGNYWVGVMLNFSDMYISTVQKSFSGTTTEISFSEFEPYVGEGPSY
jgi:hypothetical protein